MATHKKPTCPIKPKPDEEYIADKDYEIYKTIMFRMTPYKLSQDAYGRCRDNREIIPTWQSDLAKAIVPATYHFPKFVSLCSKFYDSD